MAEQLDDMRLDDPTVGDGAACIAGGCDATPTLFYRGTGRGSREWAHLRAGTLVRACEVHRSHVVLARAAGALIPPLGVGYQHARDLATRAMAVLAGEADNAEVAEAARVAGWPALAEALDDYAGCFARAAELSRIAEEALRESREAAAALRAAAAEQALGGDAISLRKRAACLYVVRCDDCHQTGGEHYAADDWIAHWDRRDATGSADSALAFDSMEEAKARAAYLRGSGLCYPTWEPEYAGGGVVWRQGLDRRCTQWQAMPLPEEVAATWPDRPGGTIICRTLPDGRELEIQVFGRHLVAKLDGQQVSPLFGDEGRPGWTADVDAEALAHDRGGESADYARRIGGMHFPLSDGWIVDAAQAAAGKDPRTMEEVAYSIGYWRGAEADARVGEEAESERFIPRTLRRLSVGLRLTRRGRSASDRQVEAAVKLAECLAERRYRLAHGDRGGALIGSDGCGAESCEVAPTLTYRGTGRGSGEWMNVLADVPVRVCESHRSEVTAARVAGALIPPMGAGYYRAADLTSSVEMVLAGEASPHEVAEAARVAVWPALAEALSAYAESNARYVLLAREAKDARASATEAADIVLASVGIPS